MTSPPPEYADESPASVLEWAMGFIEPTRIVASGPIRHGPFAGREVYFQTTEGRWTRARLVPAFGNLYQVSVVGDREEIADSVADRFLETFSLK